MRAEKNDDAYFADSKTRFADSKTRFADSKIKICRKTMRRGKLQNLQYMDLIRVQRSIN